MRNAVVILFAGSLASSGGSVRARTGRFPMNVLGLRLPRVRLAVMAMAAMVSVSLLTPPAVNAGSPAAKGPMAVVDAELQHLTTGSVRVIVQAVDGATASIPHAIARAGGHVTLPLPIINGAAATVPAKAISGLASADGIRAISLDRPVTVQGGGISTSPNSVYDQVVRADDEQRRRLAQVAARCPVRRTLEGHIQFADVVRFSEPSG